MLNPFTLSVLPALWLAAVGPVGQGSVPGGTGTRPQEPAAKSGDKMIDEKYLQTVRGAARQLGEELERFQETVVAELGGSKDRTVFRQADSLLGQVAAFETGLKATSTRKEIYKGFDEIDAKALDLFKAVEMVGKDKLRLQRLVNYLRAAVDYLHYAASAGDLSETRKKQIIERQARALTAALRELEKMASYGLAEVPRREVLLAHVRKLLAAAETFQKSTGGSDVADRFKVVNESWERVVQGFRSVPPRENVLLLRSAVRVDELHERLFRLLGIPGDRPRFT